MSNGQKRPSCPRCNSFSINNNYRRYNDNISDAQQRMMAMRLGTSYATKSINDNYCKCYSCHFIGPIDDFFKNTEEMKPNGTGTGTTNSSDDDCCCIL